MIWPWRICFSVLLGMALHAATVSGLVELQNSHEPAVSKKMDYSGVVVWLEPVDAAPSKVVAPKRALMAQKNKTFTPHVLAIPVGSTIEFPNFDPIFHNAFSNYNGQLFDVGLYPPGTTRSVHFTRPGVVRVFCNIHASMSALIVVLSTPYYATSRADGQFTILDVPPGEYQLKVHHERASAATLDHLSTRITVGAGAVMLPRITISESGYLPIPHLNKYGRSYSPAPDDGGLYPGVRK